jgi:hypothetical protein
MSTPERKAASSSLSVRPPRVARVREEPVVHARGERQGAQERADPGGVAPGGDVVHVDRRVLQFLAELGGLLVVLGIGEELRLVVAHGHDHAPAGLLGALAEGLEQGDDLKATGGWKLTWN